MKRRTTRRDFLKTAGVTGAALPFLVPGIAGGYPVNAKVRHAACGVRGMGGYDLRQIASSPHCQIVALCDIDDKHLGEAAKDHSGAQKFNDFRRMFDSAHKTIDSCHVTVPDHMHAPITMTALRLGKNVYCQKPLTHEIVEARRILLASRKAGVVTQMGTQIHSHEAYRTAVRLVHDGAIGKVTEVHTWADRAWSNNGRPKPATPPANVHWDLWLGVAPTRPWGQGAYHPKSWWSWMDFGTGNLGDMGCHLFDPVYSALELGTPTEVRAECDPPKDETWPNAGKVFYRFPGTPRTAGPISWTWHDGGFKKGFHPPVELSRLPKGENLPSQGSILIGSKGVLLIPHWSTPRLLPKEDFSDYELPKVGGKHHWHSFIDACRGEGKTTANFEYACPITESVLLGNLAKRFPTQKLEWDSKAMKVTNFNDANRFLMREYRDGWDVPGLS